MTTLQTTSSSKIDNVIELRVISKKKINLEDISYFVHNGWSNFKTDLHEGHYVLVRRNPPVEAFEFYSKVKNYDGGLDFED